MALIDELKYTAVRSAVQRKSAWRRLCSSLHKPKSEVIREEPDPSQYSPCVPDVRLSEYRALLGAAVYLAVFRNGTCVFSYNDFSKEDATELLRAYGPVAVGTPSGDYFVAQIQKPVEGYVVRYYHPSILSFVSSKDYRLGIDHVVVGTLVRMARDMDSRDLHLVAFESSRDAT